METSIKQEIQSEKEPNSSLNPITLTKALKSTYIDYLTSSFHFKDKELQKRFKEKTQEFEYLKGPILEATPPFQKGCFIADLIQKNILDAKFFDFIYDVYGFWKENPLYSHQELAILKAKEKRNLVITTGTGSGKTECFLLPILDELLREYRTNTLGPGVRALILYPMNALANDQLSRLREICNAILAHDPKCKITFGRYVGDTEEKQRDAESVFGDLFPDDKPCDSELLSREQMRANPPNILLTNYAMLEYLLLRPQDSPFFDGDQNNHWKFLVLDEAHVYNGANGIEIAMLIRRLKDRICDSKKGVIQCFATSATLISDNNDFEKVIEFASSLFGEFFEYIITDPKKQDIIEGKRIDFTVESNESLKYNISFPDYTVLESLRNDSFEKQVECFKRLKIPAEILDIAIKNAKNLSNALFYHILKYDPHFIRLKKAIKDNPIELNEISALFEEKDDSDLFKQNIISMINIGVWCKPDSASLSLLPARYHLFVRAPEGTYVAFFPTKEVFLEPHDFTAESYPVFEIATCRRCGQEYVSGYVYEGKIVKNIENLEYNIPEEDSNQQEIMTIVNPSTYSRLDKGRRKKGLKANKDRIGEPPSPFQRRFFLIQPKSMDTENEDESVSEGEKIPNAPTWKLCPQCGKVWPEMAPNQCSCDSSVYIDLREIPTEKESIDEELGTLNKCHVCGLRATGIVRTFYFQRDGPSAVLASILYEQMVQRSETKQKILTFSDSRQDAAFFASFLDLKYNQLFERRIIYRILGENKSKSDYRMKSLCNDIYAYLNAKGILDKSKDEKEHQKEIWGWILKEFCGLDKETGLEGIGLSHFEPIFPEKWNPPESLQVSAWKLTIPEIKGIYSVILDSLRYNQIITFPLDGPSSKDSIFERFHRNREFFIVGSGSDSKKGHYAFMPTSNTTNLRSEFLRKILARILKIENIKKDQPEYKMVISALEAIWVDLTTNWKGLGINPIQKKGFGIVFQLDYRFWRIRNLNENDVFYVCERCGKISFNNIRGACRTYGCQGPLKEFKYSSRKNEIDSNYYRIQYSNPIFSRLRVHEHTAQLTSEFASKIQQEFRKGQINVLSCSTTFEMGVNLGDLEVIFMKNVPPEPSNYIQRAGRAGRRTDLVGFILTFALLRSHDLSYFKNPISLVAGKIKPPVIQIKNRKIIQRHINSVVIAKFMKQIYSNIDKLPKIGEFFAFESTMISKRIEIQKYLESKPADLKTSISNIIPQNIHNEFDIENWAWVKHLTHDSPCSEGLLDLAEIQIVGEYKALQDFSEESYRKMGELIKERKILVQNNVNSRNIAWADKRMKTLKMTDLINFLAKKAIIPKYGFPVDVVELKVLSASALSSKIQLDRDLRMAISEFAPTSKVIANNFVWESAGLEKMKDREWDIYWYNKCTKCQRLIISEQKTREMPKEEPCLGCNQMIKNWKRFLTPIFGFVTDLEKEPTAPEEYRPPTQMRSRPYYVNSKNFEIQKDLKIGNLSISCNYSENGELIVICEGIKGKGFYICTTCGRGKTTFQKKAEHSTPWGRTCTNPNYEFFNLGHKFLTDVLIFSITEISKEYSEDNSLTISLLYSIIAGASLVLGIQERDLDGCIFFDQEIPHFVIFDNVPGGAGHVKRFADQNIFHEILQASLKILEHCSCGLETSCNSCLRNYRNQAFHDILKRGIVIEFLKKYL